MYDKFKKFLAGLNLIDTIVLSYCLFQVVYVSLLGYKLENQLYVAAYYMFCGIISITAIILRGRYSNIVFRFFGNLYPLILIGMFYSIAGHQVHMFFSGIFDRWIIDFENSLFGIHPTIWVQQFYHPLLNEWMLFSYSIYLLLIPFTSIWLYATHRNREWRQMLGSLLLSLFISYVIFSLLPVVGPRVAMAHLYTVELEGYIFRSFTKFLESGPMLDGGAFPSAHCSAATVMLIQVYRFGKKIFLLLSPILITLIAATVFGRYHYPVDVIAGILIGITGILLYSKLDDYWKKVKSRKLVDVAVKDEPEKVEVSQPG